MTSTIARRIKEIAKHYNVDKPVDFARKTGFSHQTASNYLDGRTPTTENLLTIQQSFDVSPDWLLTGRGEMLRSSSVHDAPPLPSINRAGKGKPYYDVDFIGGYDLVVNDQTINPTYYIDFPPFNDVDFWANVSGKSMSPFISHGDIVGLKKFDGWRDFMLYGEIYAIITEDFRTIKIVGKGKDKDHIRIIPYSKSPEFCEQDLPIHLITHVFRVKGSIKKFF